MTDKDGKTRFGPWEWIACLGILFTAGSGLVVGIANGVRMIDAIQDDGRQIKSNKRDIGRLKSRANTIEEKVGIKHPVYRDDETE